MADFCFDPTGILLGTCMSASPQSDVVRVVDTWLCVFARLRVGVLCIILAWDVAVHTQVLLAKHFLTCEENATHPLQSLVVHMEDAMAAHVVVAAQCMCHVLCSPSLMFASSLCSLCADMSRGATIGPMGPMGIGEIYDGK